MPGGASILASAAASVGFGGGRPSRPSRIITRQVVQRPRPPQTAACGTPAERLISSRVAPALARTVRPPEYVMVGPARNQSAMRQNARTAAVMRNAVQTSILANAIRPSFTSRIASVIGGAA